MNLTIDLGVATLKCGLTILAVLILIGVMQATKAANTSFYVIKLVEYEDQFPLKDLRSFNITKAIETMNTTSQNTSRSFLIYENPSYGIKLKYPTFWHKSEEESGTITKEGKDIVATFAPEQHKRAPRLFLQVEALGSQNISLKDFSTERLDRLGKLFGDLRIVEHSSMTFPTGNMSAYKVIYEFKTFTDRI